MNTQTRPSARAGSAAKRMLTGFVVVLLLIFGAYFVGLNKGKAQMAALKSESNTSGRAAQGEAQKNQGELAAVQTRSRLILARSLLYRAAVSLDQRNFGTASDDVKKAAATLAPLQPADVGANAAALEAVRRSLAAVNITVADDLETQRRALLNLTTQMDALIPEETP